AAEASGVDKGDRSKWTALAMEVANSRGLCLLAEAAQRFSGEAREETTDREDNKPSPHAAAAAAAAVVTTPGERAGSVSETAPEAAGRRRSSTTQEEQAMQRTAAEKATTLIAAGCKAGDLGAHPTQKMNGAMLEGLAWSLAGRGNAEGASFSFRGYAAAMKRAERGLDKILDREHRRPSVAAAAASVAKRSASTADDAVPLSARAPEAVGVSVPAGSENSDQIQALQLGVLGNQGLVVRGGLGMGAAFSTGAVAQGSVSAKAPAAVAGDAAAALAAVAAARTAAKAANAGWAEAGSLAKKQLTYATKANSARQVALSHAHAGAVDLMTGRPVQAAEHFELQLKEAQNAGDAILEALAERNLADTREVDEDLPGALAHLRRCRALAQRSRNSALEADACRRLSSVYAEIAGQSGGGGGGNDVGGGGGGESSERQKDGDDGDGSADGGNGTQERNRSDSGPPEPEIEIEEREDSDLEFLKSTAADRARLFAERYEAVVFGLEWPVSSGSGGELAGQGLADDDGGGRGGGEPGDRRRRSSDSGGDRIADEAAAAVPVAPVA
ncbi:unnamed protein product, partial [Ectocarpus fasciculatus]